MSGSDDLFCLKLFNKGLEQIYSHKLHLIIMIILMGPNFHGLRNKCFFMETSFHCFAKSCIQVYRKCVLCQLFLNVSISDHKDLTSPVKKPFFNGFCIRFPLIVIKPVSITMSVRYIL